MGFSTEPRGTWRSMSGATRRNWVRLIRRRVSGVARRRASGWNRRNRSGCTRRRTSGVTRRSAAQRPPGPRPRPATAVPETSVPARRDASAAARGSDRMLSERTRTRGSTTPSAARTVGSSAAAATAYPSGEGWKRSTPNIRCGSAANRGPSRSPIDTAQPPASTTPTVWASASWRLQRRASQRSGGRIGSTVPRSGHVPTTTSAPMSRSARTAATRWRTAA